jgi:hypothetical protein
MEIQMDQDIVVNLVLRAMAFNQGQAEAAKALQTTTAEVAKLNDGLKTVEAQLVKTTAVEATEAEQLKRLTTELERMRTAHAGVSASASSMEEGLRALTSTLEGVAGALAVEKLYEFGKAAIDTAEHMNQLQIATAGIIASNEKITDSSGRVVTGIAKIQAAQAQVSGVFAQLQTDAMKTTDTTKGLIEKFEALAPAAMTAGMSLEQMRQLTIAFSATTSALGIQGQQAKVDIKDLIEGVRVGNTALSIGMGLKKEDIDLAKHQGKLYEFLIDKTKDYVAANHLQAQTLTGVASGLHDFEDILMRIVGEHADEVLTEGFRNLLLSIYDTNKGGVQPLGEDLEQMGRTGGEVLSSLSSAFVDMVNVFVVGGARIGSILTDALIGIRSVAAQLGANSAVFGPQHQNAQDIHNLEDKLSTPSFLPGALSGRERGDALLSLAAKQHQAKIYENQQGAMAKAADTAATSQMGDDMQRLMGKKPFAAKGPHYNYKANPARTEHKKGSHHKPGHHADPATKADDAAMRKIMHDLEHDLHVSDLQERIEALTSDGAPLANDDRKKPRLEQAQSAMAKTHATQDDAIKKREYIESINNKIEDARNQRLVDQAKLTKDATDKQEALNVAIATGAAKNDEQAAARAFDHIKETNKAAQEALKDRYTDGKIAAEEYFKKLADLRNLDVDAEIGAERRKLQDQQAELNAKFNRASDRQGKDFKPSDIAGLALDIQSNQAAQDGLAQRSSDHKAVIGVETEKGISDSVEKRTEAGLKSGIDAVFSGSIDPISSSLETSAKDGLLKALKNTDVGKAIGNIFTDPLGGLTGAGIAATAATMIMTIASNLMKQAAADKAGALVANQDLAASADPFLKARLEVARKREEQAKKMSADNSNILTGFHDATETEFASDGSVLKLSRGQKAGLDNQSNSELQASYQAIRDAARATGDNQIALLIKNRLMSRQDGIDQLKSRLGHEDPQTVAAHETLDEIAKYELAKTTSTVDSRKKIEADGAAVVAATWRAKFDQIDEAARKSVEAQVENLRKLQTAQQEAARDRDTTSKVGVLSGNLSTATENLRNLRATAQDKRTAKTALMAEADADQTTLNDLVSRFGGKDGQGPLQLAAGSSTGYDALGNRAIKDEGYSVAQLPQKLAELVNLVSGTSVDADGNKTPNVTAYDKNTGRSYTPDQLQAFADSAVGLTDRMKKRNTVDLPKATNDAKTADQDAGIQEATISKETRLAELSMAIETRKLRSELTYGPSAKKQEAYAEVDDQMDKRKLDLFDQGVLKKGVLSPIDQESNDKVTSQLEALRTLMKANVDKQYNDSTPMPVRVVEMPKLYVAPSNAYFRAPAAPNITIGAGAINIDAKGMSPDQISAAVTHGITNAASLITRTINVENDSNGKRAQV